MTAMWERLDTLEQRYNDLTAEMARPEVAADYERLQALARERAAIEEVVELHRRYKATVRGLEGAEAVLREGADPEMAALAREELETQQAQRQHLEEELRKALLPKDPRDEKNVIVEVRAASSPQTSTACTPAMLRPIDGTSISYRPARAASAASKRSSSRCAARGSSHV